MLYAKTMAWATITLLSGLFYFKTESRDGLECLIKNGSVHYLEISIDRIMAEAKALANTAGETGSQAILAEATARITLKFNTPFQSGMTPLSLAVSLRHLAVAQSLLEYGAAIVPDGLGNLPMHYAVQNHDDAMIEMLTNHRP